MRIFCISGWFAISISPDKWSSTVSAHLLVETYPTSSGVPMGGGVGWVQTPLEILKTSQNRAKHNPIFKTVKNY